MRTIRVWVAYAIVGIVLILLGSLIAWDGLEEQREFEVSGQVDSDYIYHLKLEPKSGEEMNGTYALSEGTMTVAILSKRGLDDMIGGGFYEPADVYFERTVTNNGTIPWTPTRSGTYYLAFYGFSVDGAVLESQGTYLGSLPALIYIGLGIIAIGVVAIVMSAVLRLRKLVALRYTGRTEAVEGVTPPIDESGNIEEEDEIGKK